MAANKLIFIPFCLYLVFFYFRNNDQETAILRSKPKPNKLIVEDAINDDNSAVSMSQVTASLII